MSDDSGRIVNEVGTGYAFSIESGEPVIQKNIVFYLIGTVVLFALIFAAQWVQYNKTYTTAYEESANQ